MINDTIKDCDNCNYDNLCDYCSYCDSCYYCSFCNYCNYCRNLKMTEYNMFCYSKNYNDKNSFQKKQYRAFNKEVGEKRYYEIKNKVYAILKDFKLELNKNSWIDEWKKVTQDQWKQLLSIPEAKDFKEGFEFISGVKIDINDKKAELLKKAEELIQKANELKDEASKF